jgi:epoxyqueuosine reductase
MQKRDKLKHHFKEEAIRLGFSMVGISKAERLDKEAAQLASWLSNGNHGTMYWMENHFEKRVDPRELVPGARTVISLLYNYYTPVRQSDPEAPIVSLYAFGRDYHKVVRKKLNELMRWLQAEAGDVQGRCFVDSAPVMERQWAERSGLGWLGKNTLLIHPKKGSYFFLAELIIDLDLPPDDAIRDHCGTCTKCIDACPTDALSPEGYVLDASRCISYLTIELKDAIPGIFADKMENRVFGCDICQEVCPWNRFSTPHSEPDFIPSDELLHLPAAEWEEITEEVFDRIFSHTPVQRTKFKGLKRNLAFLNR